MAEEQGTTLRDKIEVKKEGWADKNFIKASYHMISIAEISTLIPEEAIRYLEKMAIEAVVNRVRSDALLDIQEKARSSIDPVFLKEYNIAFLHEPELEKPLLIINERHLKSLDEGRKWLKSKNLI